jgi:hypothetical protein
MGMLRFQEKFDATSMGHFYQPKLQVEGKKKKKKKKKKNLLIFVEFLKLGQYCPTLIVLPPPAHNYLIIFM